MNVTIYDQQNKALATVIAEKGSKATATLMQSDTIQLKVSLATPVTFDRGCWCSLLVTGTTATKYIVTERAFPTYNASTGGWDYTITMSAWYYAWNRYILRLDPEYGAISTTFGYTNTFIEHLALFFNCLEQIKDGGDTSIELPSDVIVHSLVQNVSTGKYYEQKDRYTWELNSKTGKYELVRENDEDYPIVDTTEIDYYSIEATSLVSSDIKYVSYDGAYIVDAINALCGSDAFDCEWWMDGTTLHFGRCENGTALSIENGKDGVLSYSKSSNEYATRIIAFGSTTNVPSRYRKKLILRVTKRQEVSSMAETSESDIDIASHMEWKGDNGEAGNWTATFATKGYVTQHKKLLISIPSIQFTCENISKITVRLLFDGTVIASETQTNDNPEDDWTPEFAINTTSPTYVTGTVGSSKDISIEVIYTVAANGTYTVESQTSSIHVKDMTDYGSYTVCIMDENRLIKPKWFDTVTTYNSSAGIYMATATLTKTNYLGVAITGSNTQVAVTLNVGLALETNKRSSEMYMLKDIGLAVGDYFMLSDIQEESVPVSFMTDEYDENVNISSFERRLMLPKDKCPGNYIDATDDMTQIVEMQKTFDDIYPKMDVPIARVKWYKEKVPNTDSDGSTYYTYPIRFEIFIAKEVLNFSSKYLTSETPQCAFQTGKLAGYTFDLSFRGNSSVTNSSGTYKGKELQSYRIVNSDTNGIDIPNELICPTGDINAKIGNVANTTSDTGEITEESGTPDHIVLLNYNANFTTAMGLVSDAEEELYRQAKAYLAKVSVIEGTYTAKMFWDYMKDLSAIPGLGRKVSITAAGFFGSTVKTSRIIGYTIDLDIRYDEATYTIGESQRYSRLGAMDRSTESVRTLATASNGVQTTTKGGDSGDSGISTNTRLWGWYQTDSPNITADLVNMMLRSAPYSQGIIGDGASADITVSNWKNFLVAIPEINTLEEFKRTDVVEDWLQDTEYTTVTTVSNVESGYNNEKISYKVYMRSVLAAVSSSTIHIVIS